MRSSKDYNIVLAGFMGAGKSTASTILSKDFNMPRFETDDIIEQNLNLTIPEIFEAYGEPLFRDEEKSVIIGLQTAKSSIISLGGGAVVKDGNIREIKKIGVVILLKASANTVYNRLINCKNRPLLKNNMSVLHINELMSQRDEKYNMAADIVVVTDDKSPNDVAAEIKKELTVYERGLL